MPHVPLGIKVLTCLGSCLASQDDGLSEQQSAFAILRQAELVPATVSDYREKLLHLRKLRHDVVQSAVPQGPLQEVTVGSVCLSFSFFLPLKLFLKVCFKSYLGGHTT